MTSDWMASGAPRDPRLLDAGSGAITSTVHDLELHARKNLSSFTHWRNFQEECHAAPNHILAVAPTGSGKTEAALLWALNQCKNHGKRKLLFLLPTTVTSNALWTRLTSFFEAHDQKVGLVHSLADLFHLNEDDSAEAERNRIETLIEKHLFFPATVATVDQLLSTLFHTGRWAMKNYAAANAAIVIDEVHAYDPHTSGLLMLAIKQLRTLGASFMVMTATMPKDLQQTIQSSLGTEVSVVREKSLLDSARNEWSVSESQLVDALTTESSESSALDLSSYAKQLIQSKNHKGDRKKILIVANDVAKCQSLARTFGYYGPACYHSRFIFKDRVRIEKEILKHQPKLLIATQVVEVSLDIDYEILLTECAPPDALSQRAGRVNRQRRPELGKVVIHAADEVSHKIYGEPKNLLERTWEQLLISQGELTEHDLIELIENVYCDFEVASHGEFVAIQAATNDCQRRMSGVFDNPRPMEDDRNAELKTRLEKYKQVSVIPSTHAQEAVDVYATSPRLLRNYEVKLPYWYVLKHRDIDTKWNQLPIPVCNVRYDEQLGVIFLADGESANAGSVTI